MPGTDSASATVVVSYGRQVLIETTAGELLRAIARGRNLQPICGDQVAWQTQPDGTTVILNVAERKNLLLRHDKRQGQRALAANVDRLLVVMAPLPEPDLPLLDCYLVAAECMNMQAAIVFNKVDTLNADQRSAWQQRLAPYQRLGYVLYFTSAHQPDKNETLIPALQDHCSVLVGQSGVGKSSLIHALVPDHAPRTQALSEAIGAGRHTTTTSRLYHLPGRVGQIVDSPGVRDFRLWRMPADTLMRSFPEFRPLLGQCRFHNCRHVNEPDCAIQQAVLAGQIPEPRFASYKRLLEQVAE